MRIFKRKRVPKQNAPEQKTLAHNDATFYWKEGLQYYHNRKFNQALANFTLAINLEPTTSELYRYRGATYEALNKISDAEQDFLAALHLTPNDSIAAYRLGMNYSQRRLFEDAIRWLKISFDNTSSLKPNNEGNDAAILTVGREVISKSLAKLLLQVQRPHEAIHYLDETIENHPHYAHAYFLKGMALAQMGRPADGIPLLEKAVRLGLPHASSALETLRRLVR